MKLSVSDFNRLEEKYNLYTDTIEGLNYWIYSRFDIWNYIRSVSEETIGAIYNAPKGLGNKIKDVFYISKNILFGKRIKKGEIDILFLNHERKIKSGGIYQCKYTEEVSRQYKQYYILERPYEMGHFKPTNEKKLIYLDRIAVKGNLYYYLEKYFNKKHLSELERELKKKLSPMFQELQEETGYKLEIDKIIHIISRRFLICKGKYGEYEKIFQKIHPKLIIEVVHYNMDCMIVNEIAKKAEIPTVELQHGNIFDSHIAYKYGKTERLRQLPDEIWLLSEYWKEDIVLPIDKERMIPVGFPYFEKRIADYKMRYHRAEDYKTILFISQGTIGEWLSRFAVRFAGVCGNLNYRIIYKLHPGEIAAWRQLYPELAATKRIEVIDDLATDLYQLFAQSNIQVGVYSTAIYEGIGFGLDTYICEMPYAEEMKRLYRKGYATLVKTPEELKQRLEQIDDGKELPEFWTKDALNNIKRQISRFV